MCSKSKRASSRYFGRNRPARVKASIIQKVQKIEGSLFGTIKAIKNLFGDVTVHQPVGDLLGELAVRIQGLVLSSSFR